jgi:hypothetical protein
MFVDSALQHGFENFVDSLDLSVGMWVIWGEKIMGES